MRYGNFTRKFGTNPEGTYQFDRHGFPARIFPSPFRRPYRSKKGSTRPLVSESADEEKLHGVVSGRPTAGTHNADRYAVDAGAS
ncbi:Hypothetical protein NTJ_09071 [Nesidiocoris tenuis]|uniref:Uncharacterized protein n=1 Tax=Nesidiocoris tenuis TaxID=355587 RepID=A0ABN7B0K6_9HEMI|nr:Hypothetical protein NTJ_09071 [Nesidiocoris tenuis]